MINEKDACLSVIGGCITIIPIEIMILFVKLNDVDVKSPSQVLGRSD